MNRQQRRAQSRERERITRSDSRMIGGEGSLFFTIFGLIAHDIFDADGEEIYQMWEIADAYLGEVAREETTLKQLENRLEAKTGLTISFK